MSNITSNLTKQRKDSLGGVDKLYLFPYVSYLRTQITENNQFLTVFPATTIYDYHSFTATFNETTSIEAGNTAWTQSLTVDFPKTIVSSEIYKLIYKDYRAIYLDRLGNYRILGLHNGLEGQITNETGADKAALNGYRVTFSGKEHTQAPFIDELTAAGFTIYAPENYVFQAGGCENFIFQDGNNFIFN